MKLAFSSARRAPWWAWVFVLVAVLGGGYVMSRSSKAVAEPGVQTPQVTVKSIAELASDAPSLQVTGVVQSKSEATVRAEKSGQAVAIYHSLGDAVGAGEIVAEIEHGSESAAIMQASAALDVANANLAKTTGGARTEQKSILASGVDTAQTSLGSAQSGAVNTLLSAYASVDSAIHGTTDKMFSNPESATPQFGVSSSDSQITANVVNQRVQLGAVLSRQHTRGNTLSSTDDLDSELATTITEVRSVRDFLDTVISNLNKGIPTYNVTDATIAADLASATAARTAITTTLSSLTTAQAGLKSARSGVSVAQQTLNQGVTGGQPEDVAAAQAAVKQAQAGLAAARAAYEHSVIRAPISGTINSFSLKRGDFVAAMSPVLTVANNGALEIVSYVTESDAGEIAVGSKVTIEGGASGVITHIAPALDPVTKKIEVRVGVDNNSKLVNGQSVLVTFVRTVHTQAIATVKRITVPISAIKIGAENVVVFTLDADKKLVAHTVTLGALLGDRVEITTGTTPDTNIIVDARGLREGQVVEVRTQ